MVTLQTNYGDIQLELDCENTPQTTANFLEYVKSGFYDQTIFHRVIDGFMIQGGGFEVNMKQKEVKSPIANEANRAKPNKRGTIAMARTNNPDSATAQFFINVTDNNFLNFTSKTPDGWGYCVFGEVVQGMDIVDLIRKAPTTSKSGHPDVPEEAVIIQKVTLDKA